MDDSYWGGAFGDTRIEGKRNPVGMERSEPTRHLIMSLYRVVYETSSGQQDVLCRFTLPSRKLILWDNGAVLTFGWTKNFTPFSI